MIDIWCDVTVDGERRRRGRLIEDSEDANRLVFFQPNKRIDSFEISSVDKAGRTATLEDGRQLSWSARCATCSQPQALKGPAAQLLERYRAQVSA